MSTTLGKPAIGVISIDEVFLADVNNTGRWLFSSFRMFNPSVSTTPLRNSSSVKLSFASMNITAKLLYDSALSVTWTETVIYQTYVNWYRTYQMPNQSYTEPLKYRAYQILDVSDTEPIRYQTYQILNLSDTESIRYWTYQILNLSDSESIRYWTYQIPNQPDTELIRHRRFW